jgi:uncharacterized protein with GYD domain
MPAYVTLGNFTEQGIKDVKHTVDRAQMVKKATEAAGGRVIGIWWLMGQYDFILIAEAPDDITASRLLLASGMQGNSRSTTLRALSEEEMAKTISGLPG